MIVNYNCDLCNNLVLIKDTKLIIRYNNISIKTGYRVCLSCYRDYKLNSLLYV